MFYPGISVKFLQFLFKNTPGLIEIRAINKEKTSARRVFCTHSSLQKVIPFLTTHKNHHLCFGVATRRKKQGNALLMLPALWADVDHKRPDLKKIPLPTFIIDSGRGVHLYWMLTEPVNIAFKKQAEKIEAILKGIAQHVNADIQSTDLPRIMRIPGTINTKYPSPCKILSYSKKKYPLSLFEPLKVTTKKKYHRPIDPVLATVDITTLIEQCQFIRWCRDNQEVVSEPLWYAMISNLAVFEGGRNIIHAFSCRHPKYSERETDYKIKHALKHTRPHTCTYIQANGFSCTGCPWYGMVRSPAGIPYKIMARQRKLKGRAM